MNQNQKVRRPKLQLTDPDFELLTSFLPVYSTENMWFTKTNEDVLKELGVDLSQGLSAEEAKVRLKKYGSNQLLAKKKKNIFQLFFAQLREWLIYILFAAVVITLFMGEYIDSVIILLVIIVNAVLGVVQEVKAGKAIEALQKMSFPKALVRRNGEVAS